jgi:hypothetical protein
MQYRLRTLLIVLALGPPVLAGYIRSYRTREVMSQYETNVMIVMHCYATSWEAAVFVPAPKVESVFSGHPVKTSKYPVVVQ